MSQSDLQSEIVRVARTWINTPFQHQGALKGQAVDCVNFVGLVAAEAGVPDVPTWANNYRRHMDGSVMLTILTEGLEFIAHPREVQPADILAFHDGRAVTVPRHLAIVSEVRFSGVVHAVHASEHGVREHRLDLSWWRRVHSAWRLKGWSA